MEQNELQMIETHEHSQKNTKTCGSCAHRERHQCGGRVIQYCGVRKSNRTQNGKLKILCKTVSCFAYKSEQE